MYKIFWQLKINTRYETLIQLISEWQNITCFIIKTLLITIIKDI